MIVHKCTSCGKISPNRIAGDDFTDAILELILNESSGNLLTVTNTDDVKMVLFGRK